MEYKGAEVSHKIRSAIKAKLMELGAYVDEELPDYIMVMVANKRAKAQMDGDLQLFLGSNTSHFTSWLYQVLQKLQEVTVGNLDKKSSKLGSSLTKDAGSTKRKSTNADGDTHRKEKRRKSSESKKSKRGDIDLSKDGKRDVEAIKPSKLSEIEKYSRTHNAKDFMNTARSETSDSVVSSTVDSKTNKKTGREKSDKLQDTLKRTINKQSLSNGSSKCEDKNYLSRLRAEALRSCDDRLGTRSASDTPEDVKSRVLCKDNSETKHSGTKSVYSQPTQRTKIVLMNSDDEDDDEDFINIKADAEAEQLLKEELPREALDTTAGTPEGTPTTSEGSALPSKATSQAAELLSQGSGERPSELPIIPLKGNLIPKRLTVAARDLPAVAGVKPGLAAVNPVSGMGGVASNAPLTSAATSAVASGQGLDLPVAIPPGRIMRKRMADVEAVDSQAKIAKEDERAVTAVSVKKRLGLQKTFSVTGVKRETDVKITSRLGLRHSSTDQRLTQRAEEGGLEVAPKKAPNTSVLSRVVPIRPRREHAREGGKHLKRDSDGHMGPTAEEEEYDPSNPAVGSVASVVRVKPRPKIPAALQANKNLILKAVAEAQKSVNSAPVRPEPAGRQPTVWKRTNAGFVRNIENNVGVTFPNRHLQSQYDDECLEQDIKPDSTRLVSGGSGNDKIIIQVSSTNSEKSVSKETSIQQNPEEMSDEDHIASVLQFHEEGEAMEEDDDDLVERGLGMDRGVTAEEADSVNTGRSVYPPVGLASRMPRERSSQQVPYNSPQFLVTLDGLDPDVFGSRSASLDDQAINKDDFDMDNLDTPTSVENSPKKAKTPIVYKADDDDESPEPSNLPKSLERCKYWPSCRLGSKCNFHHPVSPCKTFPKCPFGDKCLYIHPFCKFNSACTRRDCPFVHAAPRLLVPAAPRPVVVPKSTYTPVCHFFPKCSNVSCRYLHPKACRYGKFCSKQDCNYIHQDIPSVDKLKWTSPFKA